MTAGFFPSSSIQQEKPVGLVPRCGACGLFKSCLTPKMKPYGEGKKRVLIVGEAPGETEDKQGKHFVGQAGLFLREQLESTGYELDEDAWSTNACICRPIGSKTPDPKQVAACYPNISKTLAKTQPLVVVTLGRTALASMLTGMWDDVRDLERWVGHQIPVGPYTLCPTYHPTYLLRTHSSTLDAIFRNHLEAAFEIDEEAKPIEIGKIECLVNEDEAVAGIKDIQRTSGWVALDYETNCIKPEWPKAAIYSCALSNGKRTVSYPWTAGTREATRELIRSDCIKIASNLKMEERWTLKMLGCGVRNWGWDTMLAAHCLDNRPGVCSLKFQSFVRLGVKKYNTKVEPYFESRDGPYNRIHEIKLHDLLYYGGMDAYLEYVLAKAQQKDLGYR